jgi:hypothetical protein
MDRASKGKAAATSTGPTVAPPPKGSGARPAAALAGSGGVPTASGFYLPQLPRPIPDSGATSPYPILTEELGYPPSPLANSGGTAPGSTGTNGAKRAGSLGSTVNRALQDVLGWKIKPDDTAGFIGALNQSFQLKMVEGSVVSTWTPRSYAVQTDLSGGISGAQASIYTMAKTMLDQVLPLINGLYPLDPASDAEDVTALKDLTVNQLTNLVTEIGYLGGPRVMRAQQYFQMLMGITMRLTLTPTVSVSPNALPPPTDSALAKLPALPAQSWTNPDYVLGSLGDLRDELGLSDTVDPTYINTVADEQNVTNFRIVVDYVNSLLNAWINNIQFFTGTSTFLGTQLVVISRQLGVISETIDEVRFVLDSVFIGPAQRATLQLNFPALANVTTVLGLGNGNLPSITDLPPICLEDLLQWMQNFVGAEAQEIIQNGGRLGLGEDFNAMILQLYAQAYGLYLLAYSQPTDSITAAPAIGTARVQQSLYKLVNQLLELSTMTAPPVGVPYIAPRH